MKRMVTFGSVFKFFKARCSSSFSGFVLRVVGLAARDALCHSRALLQNSSLIAPE